MAKNRVRDNPSAGIWIAAIFGTAAVGGIAYVLTRPSSSTVSAAPSTTTADLAINATACQKAAGFVALATSNPSEGPNLYKAYTYWAQQCGSSAPAWPSGVATS